MAGRCIQCSSHYPHSSYCSECYRKLGEDLQELGDEMAKKTTELNTSKAFLSLEFDNELNADGSADLKILVKHVEDKPLYAHKIVLGNRSSVFRQMFENDMLESKTGVVRIDDASLPAIRAVIRFCYHAEIAFSVDVRAEDVLPVAHKYDIELLKTVCEKHLTQDIDHANLAKRLILAKKFEAKALLTEAIAYFRKHFEQVIMSVLNEIL